METILKRITDVQKSAFFSALICGLSAYLYTMTHHFLTYDSMWNLYTPQDMTSSGRQFLQYFCGIGSYYDLPALNGLLAILYLALASMVLVKAFDVKEKTTALLLGAVMVTFPSVISTFAYTFTVDGYMLAVLCTTLAFYLADKGAVGLIAAVLLNGISLGVYQAYFCYLILLCIVKLLLEILEKREVKRLWALAWRYLVTGAGGYLFYVITLKAAIAIKGTELSGYQGTDQVLSGSLASAGLAAGMKTAWKSFFDFARYANVLTTTGAMKAAFAVVAALSIVLFVYLFIKEKVYGRVVYIVLTLLLMVCIPFGANLISVMAPSVTFHLLIRFSWVALFMFCLLLAERAAAFAEGTKWVTVSATVLRIAFAVLVFQFIVMANVTGFNMEERYEKSYALCLRLVDRLEQTEGYESGDPVAYIGGLPNGQNYPATEVTGEDLVGYFGVNGEYVFNSTEKLSAFAAHYMNVTINAVPEEKAVALSETEAFREMPCFPAKDSLQQIDDTWVIKING